MSQSADLINQLIQRFDTTNTATTHKIRNNTMTITGFISIDLLILGYFRSINEKKVISNAVIEHCGDYYKRINRYYKKIEQSYLAAYALKLAINDGNQYLRRHQLKISLIINGYVRSQLLINININLPPLISSVLASFYDTRETFSQTQSSPLITVNNEHFAPIAIYPIFTDNYSKYNPGLTATFYGSLEIDGTSPFIYRWKIKIIEVGTNAICVIGIDRSWGESKEHGNFCKPYSCYSYYDHYAINWLGDKHYPFYDEDEVYRYCHTIQDQADKYGNDLYEFNAGDTITMEFNVPLRTLSFFKNDKYLGIAFYDICLHPDDGGYNFAMCPCKGMVVQLVDFQEILYTS